MLGAKTALPPSARAKKPFGSIAGTKIVHGQIFDNLPKSANFAACRRKPGDSAGMGTLGLIVARIERMDMVAVGLGIWGKIHRSESYWL